MKDYSNFIPSSHGYITKYEIVDKEIHVYTPASKKGEPHKYEATPEVIAYFEARLNDQYQMIVENRDIIAEETKADLVAKVIPATVGTVGLSGIATYFLFTINPALSLVGAAGIVLSIVGVKIVVSKKMKNFNDEMDVIETYIQNKEDIEETSKEDPNITEYLSKTAAGNIKTNTQLVKKGLLKETFNADFLDKTPTKDIKKLLTRYRIAKELLEEQQFFDPDVLEEIEEKERRAKERARARKRIKQTKTN